MKDSGEEQPDNPWDAFPYAVRIWKRGYRSEAAAVLERMTDGGYGEVDAAFTERAHRKLLGFARRLSWTETDRLARKTIERLPLAAFGHRLLGEALFHLGKPEEARAPTERAIELDPQDEDARALLALLRRGEPRRPRAGRRPRPWPLRQRSFDDPRHLIERYVLHGYPDLPLVRPQTVFMTLGSCFASNLGQRLQSAGYRVHSELIGEDINSSYANRYLMDWIERGPVDGPTRSIDEVYGPERRERFRSALMAANVLILTLGVAPSFFDAESGEFAFTTFGSDAARADLAERCEMRTTTVAENVTNLTAIIDTAQRLAGRRLQVVLTVSPVPLAGTTEHYSAVLADCISKSTLRLACEEILAHRREVIYWPSFEIVRWLGAHFSAGVPPVFGADDANSRHVSTWLVDLIVELFVAHHSVAPPSAVASLNRQAPHP